MYITHENHFKFGWGSGLYNFEDQTEEYWAKFGRAAYIPTSFRAECIRAAELIGKHSESPIMICFSGGLSSEIVVKSFLEAEVPFEVVIMKLNFDNEDNINYYDTKYAVDFCRDHNINVNYITVDLIDFFRNVLPDLARHYKTNNWEVLLHTQLIKQFPKHHLVMGGGDMNLRRHRNYGRNKLEGLFIEEELVSIAAIEAAREVGATGVSSRFFFHTPELMLAWLLDNDVSHWIKYEAAVFNKFVNMNHWAIKPYTLYRHWPDCVIRSKVTGNERAMTKMSQSSEHRDIKLFLENLNIYKRAEVIIDYKDLMYWLNP